MIPKKWNTVFEKIMLGKVLHGPSHPPLNARRRRRAHCPRPARIRGTRTHFVQARRLRGDGGERRPSGAADTSFLAPGAPPAERAALLQAAGQTGEQFNSPTNVTLIRTGADLILVDMGSGDRFMPTAGKLWDNLKAAGIDKAKITKVIFTHGHPDHLWGTVDELDDLAIPNAAFYVAAAEWDFWHGENAMRGLPAERAGFVTGARRNYAAIKDRVKMVKPGDDVVTGLKLIATPGHTQGHVSLELAGGDGLIVGGDALTHPLISFQHPEWKPVADHVPDQAVDTRRRLLDRLASRPLEADRLPPALSGRRAQSSARMALIASCR